MSFIGNKKNAEAQRRGDAERILGGWNRVVNAI